MTDIYERLADENEPAPLQLQPHSSRAIRRPN